MSTYKSIFGQKIKKVSADPSNPIEGQMWYNSSLGSLKVQQFVSASWASGGNMNTARRGNPNPAGIQTAGLAIGGFVPPYSALTENYNGSSWTETGDSVSYTHLRAHET